MKLPWRRTHDEEIAEEIRQHLQEAVDDLVARGMPRRDAEASARRQFGNVALIEERSREVWRWTLASDLAADVRYALRQFRRAPAFAAAAVATLAIGIGATTAIFSVADAALFNPLPFPHPDRLVTLNEIVPLIADRPIRLPAPDLIDYESRSRVFDAVGGWTPRTFELSGDRESERVQAARATSSLFDVLGIRPALGRTFTAAEDRDAVAICVISDGLWRRWFGADAAVLGRTIHLDRQPYRVIGVMPRDFAYPLRGTDSDAPTDLWVPMSFTPNERNARADNWDYNGVARMKAGVTVAQATADVDAIAQNIVRDLSPDGDHGQRFTFTAIARPLAPQISGRVRPLVLALSGAVACLLLIACVNVANLLLARGAHRRREMAVRAALGAGRGRLLRQLMTEALLLSLMSAGIGAVLAWWTTSAIAGILPSRFALLANAHVNTTALGFAIGLSLCTAVVAGIIPGLAGASAGRAASLNVRADAGSIALRRLRSALVVVEIALALVLLVGAGLLVRTFQDLLQTSAGFEPENAVAASVSLPPSQYATAQSERQLYRQLVERLHGGGIEVAGIGSTLPLSGRRSERVFWPDEYVAPPGAGYNIAGLSAVSPEYLQAIGATLRSGRLFTPQDDASGAPVAIVSASLARQYWPGRDAVGRRVKWGGRDGTRDWMQVVGVIADLKQDSLDSPGAIQIFVPVDQLEHSMEASESGAFTAGQLRAMYVVVRGHVSEAAMIARLRDTVRSLDGSLAVAGLAPLTDTVAASAAPQRFNMVLMGSFAAMALVLAIVGLYGLISYSVAQRAREIGVRMAMGAAAGTVTRMVVKEGLALAAMGTLIGAAAAAALAPALRALLYGVQPVDAATFGVVIAVLLTVAAAASYVPARRATAIDPASALRSE
ncbi:MAG TPA: ABC transporter permease [Vicinamibacterales bacterium]|jgi:predicted permease|nr:ABC transporter permease [Vicinamibacterales bacterium]